MVAESVEYEGIGWSRRLRSAVLLLLLVGVLGAAAAAVLGVLVVALSSLIDHALG